jgi:hypothetical protein
MKNKEKTKQKREGKERTLLFEEFIKSAAEHPHVAMGRGEKTNDI